VQAKITQTTCVGMVLFLLAPNIAKAGPGAEASEQKCLEMTRIVANSLTLSKEDEQYCRAFGSYMESQGITSEQGIGPMHDGMQPLLRSTVELYLQKHPEARNKCIAAQTMEAMASLFSGELGRQ